MPCKPGNRIHAVVDDKLLGRLEQYCEEHPREIGTGKRSDRPIELKPMHQSDAIEEILANALGVTLHPEGSTK